MSFPTTSILDSFTRSNVGPPPSASWTTIQGGNKISSNQFVGTSTGTNAEDVSQWNASTFGADQEGYVTIPTLAIANGDGFNIYFRMDVSFNGYVLNYNKVVAGTDSLILFTCVGGAKTTNILTISQEISSGDSLGVQVIGSSIGVWYKASGGSWTKLNSVSDSTYNHSGSLLLSTVTTAVSPGLTNFGGGSRVLSVSKMRKTLTPCGTRIGSRQVHSEWR